MGKKSGTGADFAVGKKSGTGADFAVGKNPGRERISP
jgi:hypothetical protein